MADTTNEIKKTIDIPTEIDKIILQIEELDRAYREDPIPENDYTMFVERERLYITTRQELKEQLYIFLNENAYFKRLLQLKKLSLI